MRNADADQSQCFRVCQEDADCALDAGRCIGRTLSVGIGFCR